MHLGVHICFKKLMHHRENSAKGHLLSTCSSNITAQALVTPKFKLADMQTDTPNHNVVLMHFQIEFCKKP